MHSLFLPPAVLPVYDWRYPSLLSWGISLLLQISERENPSPLVLSGSGPDSCNHGAGLHGGQQECVTAAPPGQLAQPSGHLHPGCHHAPSGLWSLRDVPQAAPSFIVSAQTEAVPRHLWPGGLSAGHSDCDVGYVLRLVPGHGERGGLVGLPPPATFSCPGGDEPDH